MSKYLFIKAQLTAWTLADLCRVLGVSRSGYYQWRAASPPPVPNWQPAAQQAFEVAYYLDTYFNLDRRHSALGYRSPHQFETDLFQHLP